MPSPLNAVLRAIAGIYTSASRHPDLLWQMMRRDVVGRYRGSVAGMAWSLVNPLMMLAVYTFVFSVVFQARWSGGEAQGRAAFAVNVFAGMIVHGLFAECVNRAPTLVLGNVNYVRKVVFPLEILPWVSMGSALFHAGMALVVLLAFLLVQQGGLHPTVVLLPLVLLPLVLLTMGLSWFLASLGVFLRDIAQMTGIVTTIALFLSPVFYPVQLLPAAYRWAFYANPLTFPIEQARQVLVAGAMPDWLALAAYTAGSAVVAALGLAWFQRTRKGFADVV
jgi:lipopolysaccharide transport system permease protein